MFDWAGNETVYRIRPHRGTDRGETYLDYTPAGGAERTAVHDVIVAPATGTENGQQVRDAVQAQYAVTDTGSPRGFWRDSDHVELWGEQYQIEGHVQQWPSPTGDLDHAYMLVNRWEG